MLPKYAGEPSKTRLKDSLFSWLRYFNSILKVYNILTKLSSFRIIISDSKSRNLFFYLLINFTFAFVELTYGIWTNSLGLITDSFHMFFDCTALIAGLIASVIAKWRATDKYTYGYVF
jgi:zinc transporter 5/7